MGVAGTLTRRLFSPDIDPKEAAKGLQEAASHTNVTHDIARHYGTEPRPARTFWYDPDLVGTGTQAYNIDPKEVRKMSPYMAMFLENEIGPDPGIGVNPEVVSKQSGLRSQIRRLYRNSFDMAERVYVGLRNKIYKHEAGHGGQQGKMEAKQVVAQTAYGTLPIGEIMIEGGLEVALEQTGHGAPSREFDAMSGGRSSYGLYRDLVYRLEQKRKGISTEFLRVADKYGPKAAAELLAKVPDVGGILTEYAGVLNRRPAYRTA